MMKKIELYITNYEKNYGHITYIDRDTNSPLYNEYVHALIEAKAIRIQIYSNNLENEFLYFLTKIDDNLHKPANKTN